MREQILHTTEIDVWSVTAIPWIVIFDKHGKRIDTIIEKPKYKPTLESELLYVITRALERVK